MAELSRRERLQPSLLDRLSDNAPTSRRESADQQSLSMQQLRQAVLRDLAWLLNTTNLAAVQDLDEFPGVAATTLNFGVPGFTGLVAAAEKISTLEAAIAAAIRNYEPRIRPDSLRVRAREAREDQAVPTLVFDIQGELWAQPVPQQLFLETSIDIETRLAVVTDVKARG
jgi:type VI secretion system protein ImpF